MDWLFAESASESGLHSRSYIRVYEYFTMCILSECATSSEVVYYMYRMVHISPPTIHRLCLLSLSFWFGAPVHGIAGCFHSAH